MIDVIEKNLIDFEPPRLSEVALGQLQSELSGASDSRAKEVELAKKIARCLPLGIETVINGTAQSIADQLEKPSMGDAILLALEEREQASIDRIHQDVMQAFADTANNIVGPRT